MESAQIQVQLRECISQSQYSQRQIAQAIGVSAQTISKYMKQNIFPAPDTLSKLCMLRGVRADYIPGLTNEY